MQTTETINEKWNMYSLFEDCLPRIIDVAEKKNSCRNSKQTHKLNYYKQIIHKNKVRRKNFSAIIQCKANKTNPVDTFK